MADSYGQGYAADYLEGSWSNTFDYGNSGYSSTPGVDTPYIYNPEKPPVAGSAGTSSAWNKYTPYGDEEKTSTTKSTSGFKTSGTTAKPIGTVSYQTSVAPKTAAPVLGAMPEFAGPEWDEREVRRLTQVKSAPGVRRLRTAVQQAMATPHENPNVKALSLREALGGYGQGLQSVMTGAESAAQSEYGRRYAQEYQGKAMAYQANIQAKMAEYQAAMQNYMRQFSTVGYTRSVYDKNQMPNMETELDKLYLPQTVDFV